MANETIYRVIFHNQRQVFDLYARSVSAGDMIGFVVVEALTFGERTQMVVDPSEERLRSEFDGVERTFIPMHSVVRIDEVDRIGASKITDSDGKVTPFPGSQGQPGPNGSSQ